MGHCKRGCLFLFVLMLFWACGKRKSTDGEHDDAPIPTTTPAPPQPLPSSGPPTSSSHSVSPAISVDDCAPIRQAIADRSSHPPYVSVTTRPAIDWNGAPIINSATNKHEETAVVTVTARSEGPYLCQKPIIIDASFVTLQGQGDQKIQIRMSDKARAPILIIGDADPLNDDETPKVQYVEIRNLDFDGNRWGQIDAQDRLQLLREFQENEGLRRAFVTARRLDTNRSIDFESIAAIEDLDQQVKAALNEPAEETKTTQEIERQTLKVFRKLRLQRVDGSAFSAIKEYATKLRLSQTRFECWQGTCDPTDGVHLRNSGITIRSAGYVRAINVRVVNNLSGGVVIDRNSNHIDVETFESADNLFDGLAGYKTTSSRFSKMNIHDNIHAAVSLDLGFNNNSFADSQFNNNGDVAIFARDSHDNQFIGIQMVGNKGDGVFLAQSDSDDTDTGAKQFRFKQVEIKGSLGFGIQIADPGCTGTTIEDSRIIDNRRGSILANDVDVEIDRRSVIR